MSRWGTTNQPEVFEELQAAYAEAQRHYHTAAHIDACLGHLDEVYDLAESPAEVELALWFHDAVYDVHAQDNERRSAEWARSFLSKAGATGEHCDRVAAHILATEHSGEPEVPDSALVVDIDLAILGGSPAAYGTFEDNIRKEYAWVPAELFRRKRKEILESFLSRPSVYRTAHFRNRLEAAAQSNLRAAIDALS